MTGGSRNKIIVQAIWRIPIKKKFLMSFKYFNKIILKILFDGMILKDGNFFSHSIIDNTVQHMGSLLTQVNSLTKDVGEGKSALFRFIYHIGTINNPFIELSVYLKKQSLFFYSRHILQLQMPK